MRLLAILNDCPDLEKIFKPISGFYKSAGKIRDLYILQNLIKGFRDDAPNESKKCIRWLKKEEKKLLKEFTCSFCPVVGEEIKSISESLLNSVRVFAPKVTGKDCCSYVDFEMNTIRKCKFVRPGDEALHQIRMHLKATVYAIQILADDDFSATFYKKQLATLDKLQEDLGYINDLSNLAKMLRTLNSRKVKFPQLEWIVSVEKGKVSSELVQKLNALS